MARRRYQIPAIAHLGGLTVGVDTIQKLETMWGPGIPFPGQHPMGGRCWFGPDYQINADGFDYNAADHRVLNSLAISASDAGSGKETGNHIIHAPRDSFRFLGMALGTPRAQVLRLLRARLPAPQHGRFGLEWKIPGRVLVREPSPGDREYYTEWDAELGFDHGVLTDIDLGCE